MTDNENSFGPAEWDKLVQGLPLEASHREIVLMCANIIWSYMPYLSQGNIIMLSADIAAQLQMRKEAAEKGDPNA